MDIGNLYLLLTHSVRSKSVAQADLHFAWVAEARLYGAVKVEEQARAGGIAEVVCVEQIEDFDNGFQMAVAQWDGAGQACVP